MNKKNKIKIKLNGKIIFIPKNTSLKNLAGLKSVIIVRHYDKKTL